MSASPTRRWPLVVAVASAASLALTACGGTDAEGGSPSTSTSTSSGAAVAPVSNGAAQVRITATQKDGRDTCALDHVSAASGPVTFTVSNRDATGITEVELLSDARILGEKENLAPGLAAVTFTATLSGGTYQVYCPGADPETQPFTVTGQASSTPTGSTQAILAEGVVGYAAYVTGVITDMQAAVAELRTAVDSGDVDASKKAYAAVRPFYEKVESDVEGFIEPGADPTANAGNLDYLVDMRGSNLDPAVGWSGMHAIERDLWQGGKITVQTKKYAADLQTNIGKLTAVAKTLTYKPEDLANGAAGLLEEVQSGKITGEEEEFSHLDLVDFSANVEGAQQAFSFLEPGLQKIDPALTSSVTTQFTVVRDQLNTYRDATALGGFKAYTAALRTSGAAELSKAVQGLQDPLSRIAEKVATTQ
ncbi:MAG: iron uptake system protein EfeO [Lapillicoccus sp.]